MFIDKREKKDSLIHSDMREIIVNYEEIIMEKNEDKLAQVVNSQKVVEDKIKNRYNTQSTPEPKPSNEDIRRQLGWFLK